MIESLPGPVPLIERLRNVVPKAARTSPDELLAATFLHLTGIGPKREQGLWTAGIRSWAELEYYLAGGGRITSMGAVREAHQLGFLGREIVHRPTSLVLAELSSSREAVDTTNLNFFLARLASGEHWRVLGPYVDDALFLDIETTGLSLKHCYVTVIGALYQKRFYQWVWGDDLEQLAELLAAARLVVTYNGDRFDLPFLRLHLPGLPAPRAHVDLAHVARAAGITGGQKALEEELGLKRRRGIRGLTGADAVVRWCEALYGRRRAFDQLLEYNRADVSALPTLSTLLVNHHSQRMSWSNYQAPRRRSTYPVHIRGTHETVRSRWLDRRITIAEVASRIEQRFGCQPRVVGIDLRGKSKNPTGWAVCEGAATSTRILFEDDEIVRATLDAKPAVVSIDAPLSVPRHFDTNRKKATIVRDAERILWSRGIPVYPAMINQMVALTRRGIQLAQLFEKEGIPTVESYPGAAQDLLGIPRKGASLQTLHRGLSDFGYAIRKGVDHDELDAITSALVGQLFLSDQFEAIGAADEGFMLLPRMSERLRWRDNGAAPQKARRVICITGLPGSGKTSLAMLISRHLQIPALYLGESLRERAESDNALRQTLARGKLAPEEVVRELIADFLSQGPGGDALIDGFPRHLPQMSYVTSRVADWVVVNLQIARRQILRRLALRAHVTRGRRPEDERALVRDRLRRGVSSLRSVFRELPDERVILISADRSVAVAAGALAVRLRATTR